MKKKDNTYQLGDQEGAGMLELAVTRAYGGDVQGEEKGGGR